jgi:hypothetical protein
LIFLVLIAVAGLSGCSVLQSVIGSPDKQEVCTPNAPVINIYRATPEPWINMVLQYASTYATIPTMTPSPVIDMFATSTPPVPIIPSPRSIAFQCLINKTERLSDTEIIKVDNFEVQVTVTFISPDLLQAVFLGEFLKNSFSLSEFETQVQTVLGSVAERDELLFLFTITKNGSTDTSSHTIDMPVQEMALTNGEWLAVKPKHADQILDQPIDLSDGPVFGYVAYPLAVLTNNTCSLVLEPKYSTSLVLTMPSYQLDGIDSKVSHSWAIPYSSLMHVENSAEVFQSCIFPTYDLSLISPTPLPPDVNSNQSNYWQEFARFVWYQLTLGNY